MAVINTQTCPRKKVSKIRKRYIFRLIGRIFILLGCAALLIVSPGSFDIIQKGQFFSSFSVIHVLWVLWCADMIQQLVPVKDKIPLGSQKHLKYRFKPMLEKINYKSLHSYIVTATKSAYKVFLIWAALILGLGFLYYHRFLSALHLFFITVVFYVCDLICVLIWCPFRLIMKNRCCTTCRIFNWDHLMMFTPMLFVSSFFSASLLFMAFVVWAVWESCVLIYPERFWEKTNSALRCVNCTDKLCTQYCERNTVKTSF